MLAQQTSPAVPPPPGSTATPAPTIALPDAPDAPDARVKHNFWDKKNLVLFGTVAALNTADFAATRSNLQNGGTELDPFVRVFGRSTAGLAVSFSAETARVIGLSYLFHRTGHHKLERAVSMINIAASVAAVSYDLSQR